MIYKGFDLEHKHDQFGMISAARYEYKHQDDPNDKILLRAKELRELWEKQGIYHTSTITSVKCALEGM